MVKFTKNLNKFYPEGLANKHKYINDYTSSGMSTSVILAVNMQQWVLPIKLPHRKHLLFSHTSSEQQNASASRWALKAKSTDVLQTETNTANN